MNKPLPSISSWPHYEPDEMQAALITLESGLVNYWTGEAGKLFEKTYAEYVGKRYGIALSNGTVALELALRAFSIGPGDEVIVPSRSYVASASCVLVVGATPVFADVDISTGNISPDTIKTLINKKTKAIIPVHIGGLPCDMSPIMRLANTYNLKVIEDCAQAHGAIVDNKPVGAWGHAAIFSFCQDKIISTGGEGGMLLLSEAAAYKSAWAYKDIGRDYDAVYNQDHPPGFRWQTHHTGSNFRMTEFQSAIGLKQLVKLDGWVNRRNEIANKLKCVLEKFPFIQLEHEGTHVTRHAHYRLYAKVKPNIETNGLSNQALRDQIINELTGNGIPCFSGSCSEVYLEKAFDGLGQNTRKQNAKLYSENAFCLLTHHTITNKELDNIIRVTQETLQALDS